MALTVVTINLWNVEGPVRDRLQTLGAWLAHERPDVVALQEVADLDGRSQAALLAGMGGYPHLHEDRAGDDAEAGEGLALLSRQPLSPRPTVPLPRAADDPPRAAVVADVDGGARRWRLVCTHLAWRLDAGDDRAAQARRLRDALTVPDGDDAPALVVTGDLNDVPGSPALRALTEDADVHGGRRWAGLVDALVAGGGADRPTFDLANPYFEDATLAGRRVDHILVAPDVGVRRARLVLTGEREPVVSDHYGVLAELD